MCAGAAAQEGKKRPRPVTGAGGCSRTRDRTWNLPVNGRVLCQLSYSRLSRITRRAAGPCSGEGGRAGLDQQDEQADQAFGHGAPPSAEKRPRSTGVGARALREGAVCRGYLLSNHVGADLISVSTSCANGSSLPAESRHRGFGVRTTAGNCELCVSGAKSKVSTRPGDLVSILGRTFRIQDDRFLRPRSRHPTSALRYRSPCESHTGPSYFAGSHSHRIWSSCPQSAASLGHPMGASRYVGECDTFCCRRECSPLGCVGKRFGEEARTS